jgi:hypothetical protein
MGHWECISLLVRGDQVRIMHPLIHFRECGFHWKATSQKTCGAWRKQSEAKVRRLCVWRCSRSRIKRTSAKQNWQSNADITNHEWYMPKAYRAGSTSLSSSHSPVPLGLTLSRYWRSSKPPRSPTTKSENEEWLSCSTSAALSLGGFRKDQLVYTLVGKTCELMNVVCEYANSLAPRCGKSLSIE